jgi:hypothetical protein
MGHVLSDPLPKLQDMKKRCPSCKSETGLRKIIYGLSAEPLDESKYLIGGCCITGNDPTHECIECGWQVFRKKKDPLTQSIN